MDEKERIYNAMMTKLVESGEKERLKQLLKSKLHNNANESFHDCLTEQAKELIRKRGQERIAVEELMIDLLPYARGVWFSPRL